MQRHCNFKFGPLASQTEKMQNHSSTGPITCHNARNKSTGKHIEPLVLPAAYICPIFYLQSTAHIGTIKGRCSPPLVAPQQGPGSAHAHLMDLSFAKSWRLIMATTTGWSRLKPAGQGRGLSHMRRGVPARVGHLGVQGRGSLCHRSTCWNGAPETGAASHPRALLPLAPVCCPQPRAARRT